MSATEDDSGIGSDKADSDVFVSDYKHFLHNQIRNVIESERSKRSTFDKCDELHIAIDLCKKLLVEMGENEESKRKHVLDFLIELKLELTQLEENLQNGESMENARRWQGHEFQLQSVRGRNPYCETCVATIWRLAQAWRRCTKCGFRTHDKCIPNIIGQCAASIVSEPDFELEYRICPESTLNQQNYECYECHAAVGYEEGTEAEPRLCDYTGKYYCRKCHWNDLMVIPARVIRNWDFEPRYVCRSSKKLLVVTDKKPIINLEKENPSLLQFIDAVNEVCKLRKQVMLMKCFFLCCRWARKLRILQHLNKYQHFVESSENYSLIDLQQIAKGTLLEELKTIVGIFKKHITEECETCKGNAFVCELCPSNEYIYPFSENSSICRHCCAVFHQQCFATVSRRCPRCARREARKCAVVTEQEEIESK
uniref:Phorbol-ester/DAG-type domain-containing protein n=1 Tax=Panagrolaimus superbus TaxID=310955 RepID=A0A914ZA85_9BILA